MYVRTLGQTLIDPYLYPGRLLIHVETDNRPDCGIFLGKIPDHGSKLKAGERLPTIPDEDGAWGPGVELFEIEGHRSARENNGYRDYYFSVISWESSYYISYPQGQSLVLSSDSSGWSVHFQGVHLCLDAEFPLNLNMYKPVYGARGWEKASDS